MSCLAATLRGPIFQRRAGASADFVNIFILVEPVSIELTSPALQAGANPSQLKLQIRQPFLSSNMPGLVLHTPE